jgi:endo-1,4-beta-xylanase
MISRESLTFAAPWKRMKRLAARILPSLLVGVLVIASVTQAQPAKGAKKFLGNICGNSVRSDFGTYWNQISPENAGKWGSVEATRDRYSFTGLDAMKTYAETNGIPWKLHTLVWGSQYPSWITGLSQTEQLAEITEWMDTLSSRYPNVNMIDVVNEGYASHAPAPYKAALGGDGATGYDWIIKAFQMARARWPKAILIYNDFNNIEWNNEVNWTPTLISALKKANAPIDGIGCQAHDAFQIASGTLKSNIDKLAATGLPLYITEFDIPDGNDANQKAIMEEKFTIFWNHPKIVGITYWGYIVGQTWKSGTGLLNTNGTERPALTWLKDYVKNNPNPPLDFPSNVISIGAPFKSARWNDAFDPGQGRMRILDLQGRTAGSSYADHSGIPTLLALPASGHYVVKQDGRIGMVSRIQGHR